MNARNRRRLAAAVAAVAMLAVASPSFAFRMISVCCNGRHIEGAAVSCDDTDGFTHPASGVMSWYLNTSLQGAGKDNNITPAMSAWNSVSGTPYLMAYAGTTTAGFSTDGRNTMVWHTLNGCSTSGCLALTALVVQSRKTIVEADITFNNNQVWRTDLEDYDVQTVATHELGHSLGIHHSEVTSSPVPTMVAGYFGTHGRTLESDDRQAVQCSKDWYVSPVWESLHENVTTCRDTKGWIWNSKRPNGRVNVELWANSTLLTTVSASICRPDLAGKGDGCHGFSFAPGSRSLINDGRLWNISAKNARTGDNLTGTGHPLYCKAQVFKTQAPTELNPVTTSWSVGNVISADRNGYVRSLRYYRGANETGLHTLKLWTESGSLLGEVPVNFGPATTARWEQGDLSGQGVLIQAGTRYVVTVTTTTQQSKTPCGLSPPISNGPLTAHGGRWVEGNGIFPTNTSCSNFWTDLLFDQ